MAFRKRQASTVSSPHSARCERTRREGLSTAAHVTLVFTYIYDVLPFVFFLNSICWRSMKLRLKREWIYFRIWSNTFTPSASKFFFFVMSFQMCLSSWQILVDMNSMTSRNSQHSCENLQRKGWGTDRRQRGQTSNVSDERSHTPKATRRVSLCLKGQE